MDALTSTQLGGLTTSQVNVLTSSQIAALDTTAIKGLTTAQELSSLEYTYTTAGVAQARTADKQVSTGTGSITRISTFGAGPVSITFVVSIDQKVTSKGATSSVPDNNYTITVVSSGGGWLIARPAKRSQIVASRASSPVV